MTYAVMVDSDTTTGSGPTEVVRPAVAAANTPSVAHRAVPLFVPTDEVYYWSYAWQESERLSRAQLDAGEYVEFDNPTDMVRWSQRLGCPGSGSHRISGRRSTPSRWRCETRLRAASYSCRHGSPASRSRARRRCRACATSSSRAPAAATG